MEYEVALRRELSGIERNLETIRVMARYVEAAVVRIESALPADGSSQKPEGTVCDAKVWAVKRVSGILPGAELPLVRLFSSRDGASRYMGCNQLDPADYGITEYEVADD